MIAPPYPPTTELVAVAWLSQRVPGLSGDVVATSLPKTLPADGFVTVQAIPNGADVDVPQRRRGYLQLDAWAAPPSGSLKAPWARANRLAELIYTATFDDVQTFGKPVALPEGYAGARVQAVYVGTEPQRIEGDPSGFARYQLDLFVDWVPNP